MKKIVIAVALAFGLGAIGAATPTDAKGVNDARFKACWKKVMPQRGYGPGAITAVDMCSRGLTW